MGDFDGRSDLEKVGLFRDGPYDLTVLKPIDTKRSWYERDWGKDVGGEGSTGKPPYPVIGWPKCKAATNDWTFDQSPYKSINEKVPYETSNFLEKNDPKKNISESTFITTFPRVCLNGSGSLYSSFGKRLSYLSPAVREDVKSSGQDKKLRNFYTKPGKKGTGYGYIDVTINPYPNYMKDPYKDSIDIRKGLREKEVGKMIDGVFVPAGHVNEYFTKNPFYDSKDPDGVKETYDFGRLRPKNGDKKDVGRVWVSGSKAREQKYPSYSPSDKYKGLMGNVSRDEVKVKDSGKPNWKPALLGAKTRQQTSTLNYNVKLHVNAGNFYRF